MITLKCKMCGGDLLRRGGDQCAAARLGHSRLHHRGRHARRDCALGRCFEKEGLIDAGAPVSRRFLGEPVCRRIPEAHPAKELEEDMKSQLGDIQQALVEGDSDSAKKPCGKLMGSLAERNRVCSVSK